MNDLSNEVRRIQNLKQNKNKSLSQIQKQAQINLWTKQLDIESQLEDSTEKIIAIEYLESYFNNYEFVDFAEVKTLGDLVYNEILALRVKKQLNKVFSDVNNKFVPDKAIASLHDIENTIQVLKDRLGIGRKKEQGPLDAFLSLINRFKLYIPFNRNEFTAYLPVICKKCGNENVEPILLRKRVKDFQLLKHPFFSGRFYYNARGIALVEKGVWTKEQYAWVFYTSPSYVDWCIQHKNDLIEIDGKTQEEINAFIKNNPYLTVGKIPQEI